MKMSAFVLRAHTNGDADAAVGDVVELAISQFEDFRGVGLVREATDTEIAASKKVVKAK
jgi:hypothetical protein